MNGKELKKAILCCRKDDCENCPALGEICDHLRVDMEDLPVELVDKVLEALDDGLYIVQ